MTGAALLLWAVTAADSPAVAAKAPAVDLTAEADVDGEVDGPDKAQGKADDRRSEHALALARLRAGRLDEAVALLARAAARDPANAAIATDYGFALGRAGRRVEAEAVLRGAIEKDPKRFYAYVNLADLLAADPARWDRADAVVAFLGKGLDALKSDRKGRFNVIAAVAGFERAVGRTSAARARLAPLIAPDAPPLGRAQRKRVLDLLDAIALDERSHALEDWPAPAPELARAHLDSARALEAAGRVDEATHDLEIAVNLSPSNAEAWRMLGRLLAEHGGALELERADEALQQALTLEPAWSDLRALRAKIARRRSAARASAPAPRRTAPSERARSLYQEAEDWLDVGDPIGLGRELLEQALDDSPGFVAAALSLYALVGTVPRATVEALDDDGPALWALASGVRALGQSGGVRDKKAVPDGSSPVDAVEALIRPWIDRAVALGVQEARFARAVSRAGAGDREGALQDLIAYIAREPRPERLAEARALRAGLSADGAREAGGAGPGGKVDGQAGRAGQAGGLAPRDPGASAQRLARVRLLEGKPEAALRALGGGCGPGVPVDRLIAIGLVHEFSDRRDAARACYERAVASGGAGAPEARALARLAALDARLTDGELAEADRAPLDRAAASGHAAAEWALARLAAAGGDDATALARTARALALAARDPRPTDVWIGAAQATAHRLSAARVAAARSQRERRRWGVLGGALLAVVLAVSAARWRWHGLTVAAALRRRPGLYPEVARAVGELRHDVLKHRAGVLGAMPDPTDAGAPRDEIARALLEPRPTSAVTAGIYDRLAQAARGANVALRPLGREPVFGGIARDLARAEQLLSAGAAAPGDVAAIGALDERLRTVHADGLADLLLLGPRTRVDAAALTGWISAVEAATRQAGQAWAAPGLAMADLAVEFPVEEDALAAIFANLLRNAQAAVGVQTDARVVVRVDRERDVTGRQQVTLLVGDSARAPLTLEAIEARESGRGLAIVRDLVRAWRGHLVIRPEAAPLSKLVGASFPL